MDSPNRGRSVTIYGADDKEGRTLQIGTGGEKIKDADLCALSAAERGLCTAKKTEEILTCPA